MQKRGWILIGIVIAAIVISAVVINNNEKKTELPNPASVYCTEHEGNLEIVTLKDGGQYGLCRFDDNSSCEEWAFYRGECDKGSKTLCERDDDCIADSCCHSRKCVAKSAAPKCSGIVCSQECVPGTLDCGQGSCSCVNNECEASFNE